MAVTWNFFRIVFLPGFRLCLFTLAGGGGSRRRFIVFRLASPGGLFAMQTWDSKFQIPTGNMQENSKLIQIEFKHVPNKSKHQTGLVETVEIG